MLYCINMYSWLLKDDSRCSFKTACGTETVGQSGRGSMPDEAPSKMIHKYPTGWGNDWTLHKMPSWYWGYTYPSRERSLASPFPSGTFEDTVIFRTSPFGGICDRSLEGRFPFMYLHGKLDRGRLFLWGFSQGILLQKRAGCVNPDQFHHSVVPWLVFGRDIYI